MTDVFQAWLTGRRSKVHTVVGDILNNLMDTSGRVRIEEYMVPPGTDLLFSRGHPS